MAAYRDGAHGRVVVSAFLLWCCAIGGSTRGTSVSKVCYICRRKRADKHMDGHRCADHSECLRAAGNRLADSHAAIAKRRPQTGGF